MGVQGIEEVQIIPRSGGVCIVKLLNRRYQSISANLSSKAQIAWNSFVGDTFDGKLAFALA